MSCHYFDTKYKNHRIQVALGYDRRLDYYHLVILYLDSPPADPKPANDQEQDELVLYSNMSDPEAGFVQDLQYYRARLAAFGITIPDSMFRETEKDAMNNVGNRSVRHDENGNLQPGGPS